jgi:hypothetical protein
VKPRETGVNSGDFVAVEGRDGGRTVARVWPSDTSDAGRGIIRIDGQLRQAANASIDDRVERTDGYVGADIEAVCREAATIAVRGYVRATASGSTRNTRNPKPATKSRPYSSSTWNCVCLPWKRLVLTTITVYR